MLYVSTFSRRSPTSLVLERVPLASLLEGFALLGFNSVQTFLGASSGLSICHTEDIISCHSSVDSGVPWDGLAELWHLLALRDFVDAVEVVQSFVVGLSWLVLSLSVYPLDVSVLRVLSGNLLGKGVTWDSRSIESMDGRWWHWLLSQINQYSIATVYLPS